MREATTNILFLTIGVVIAVCYFHSCSPKPAATETIRHDTVTEIVHFPVISGEGKSVLKYTYSPTKRDTVTINNTQIIHDTISGFTATLDTIQNKDTLHLEFTYPDAMFRYSLSRQPDSFKVVNTTTEIVRFEQVNWYEKPLFVSSVTAGVLVAIFGVVR